MQIIFIILLSLGLAFPALAQAPQTQPCRKKQQQCLTATHWKDSAHDTAGHEAAARQISLGDAKA
jgi:hypothetical protein